MISSLRARSRPPPRPPAVSARPSSCRQPVTRRVADSASAAASVEGSLSPNAAAYASAPAPPTMKPASGNAQLARAISQVSIGAEKPSGRRVQIAGSRSIISPESRLVRSHGRPRLDPQDGHDDGNAIRPPERAPPEQNQWTGGAEKQIFRGRNICQPP